MEKIKHYPLQFTENDLKELKDLAEKNNKSLKEYLYDAIKKQMERDKE